MTAAYQLCQPLFRKLCADATLQGRAIAGKQRPLSALLMNSGVGEMAIQQTARFRFRIWTLETRKHCQLALRMDCLLHAVDLGIDIRPLMLDPCVALYHSCWQHRYHGFRDSMVYYCFDSLISGSSRPWKWRAGQTLLEMAIRCGQLDATRCLSHAHCEATGLTASDLGLGFRV